MWWSLVSMALAAPPPWTGLWVGSWNEREFWLALQDAAGRPGLQPVQLEERTAPALGPQLLLEDSPGWTVLAGAPLYGPRPALLLGLSGPEDAQRWLLLDPLALERGQLQVLGELGLRCAAPSKVVLQDLRLSLRCADGAQDHTLPALPPGGRDLESWIAAQGEVPAWRSRSTPGRDQVLLPGLRGTRFGVDPSSAWGPALLWDVSSAWQGQRWSPEPLPAPPAEQTLSLRCGDVLAADPWRALPAPPPFQQELMKLSRPLLRGPAHDLLVERMEGLEQELARCNADDQQPACASEAARSAYLLLDALAPDSWRSFMAQASLRSELMLWATLPPLGPLDHMGTDDIMAMHRDSGRGVLLVAERLRRRGAPERATTMALLAAMVGLSREDLRYDLLTYAPLGASQNRWVLAQDMLAMAVKEGMASPEQALPLLAEAEEQLGEPTPESVPRRLREAITALEADRQRRYGPPAPAGDATDPGKAALAWLAARQELILEVVARGAQRGSIALPAALSVRLTWSPMGQVESAQVWGAALAPALERGLLWSGPGQGRAAELPILAPPGSRGAVVELRLEP